MRLKIEIGEVHLKSPATIATMRRMVRIAVLIRALIHKGDNTHNQGQLITLVSLRPTNNTVRAPEKPIPEDEEDEEDEDIVLNCDGLITFCSIWSRSLLIEFKHGREHLSFAWDCDFASPKQISD